jgi:radical SAM protein with 4Fe4S-binding SPASM domain
MLVPVGCGLNIPDNQRLTPERSEEILTWLFEKSLALKDQLHIKATCAPQYFRIMHEAAHKQGLSLPKMHHGMQAVTRGCLAGSNVCFISRTADVQPCGYLPLIVGNALTTPFKTLWTTADVFQSLRNPALLKGKCQSCVYRTLCQGCRARAYALTNDFLAEDPDCNYRH